MVIAEVHTQADNQYPSQYETDAVLRDGSSIRLRPIRRDDADGWMAFIGRLSPHTRYLRFHNVPKTMDREEALRFCTVDYNNTFAFVAEVTRGDRKDIVAIGRYYRLPGRRSAEVAFVVDDAYRRKGIGTRLLESLAAAARDHGITTFEADVLAENDHMMGVFRDYGFHMTSDLQAGVYHVTFPIARTPRVARQEEERDRLAALASMRSIICPRSVAVIGASRKPGALGNLVLECIIRNRFSGVVYPVNPNAESILSVKAYPSVLDVPGEVELAVIVVPAEMAARVTDECGRKGVRAVIVISDGFKERGGEGIRRELELRDIALGHGMRLVGPNCMGVINTDPNVSMNATFSPIFPPPGNVAFLSQSGAMGLVILEYASSLDMGISTFASVGNRADVASDDLLQYWGDDGASRVILLYLESFGKPGMFIRAARRVSARKPIVVVKGGRTAAGSRAASSHTGAMATPEIVTDALFHQTGMLRVNTIEELFDVATMLSNQPLPKGRRVAIVTNGGGPGIIAADACASQGLTLPVLSPPLTEKLKTVVRRDISLGNPLDLTAGATTAEFEGVLKVLAEEADIDAVLTIFIPPVIVSTTDMEDAIRRVSSLFQRKRKPLAACFMGQRGFKAKLGTPGKFVPCYPFPEGAVFALARASEYAEMRSRPRGIVPRLHGVKCDAVRRSIDQVMKQSAKRPLWLSPSEVYSLLDCYGIRMVKTLIAPTAEEAATLAAGMGFPVAVKLNSSTITHKTDVGGVALGLNSEAEVRKAFTGIRKKLAAIGREGEMQGAILQNMIIDGVEAIAGITQDPTFGPLIMFGIGGTYAELLNDVSLRLHPLTDIDAKEMVGSLRMGKLFEGFRGAPPADTQAAEDMLLRLSALVEDVPEIAQLDLNPVKIMPRGEGYWVADARIMLK